MTAIDVVHLLEVAAAAVAFAGGMLAWRSARRPG
jgi:hypothetical protein